jgi:hypothetical protein
MEAMMEIKLAGREIPRNEKGDPKFESLSHVTQTFRESEIVELVNRALYQIEYQREAHRKRGQKERDVAKAVKAELKKQGLDPKKAQVERELKGGK